MLKDTSLVNELFETKKEIMHLQDVLKDQIIPNIMKTCLDNKELQYITLNYSKLHKDFIRSRHKK